MRFREFLIEVTVPDYSFSDKVLKYLKNGSEHFWKANIDNVQEVQHAFNQALLDGDETILDQIVFSTEDGSHSTLQDYAKIGISGAETIPNENIVIKLNSANILDILKGDTDVSLSKFLNAIKRLLDHELIHKAQLEKAGDDSHKATKGAINAKSNKEYFKHHLEVEGYAHQALEELLEKYSLTEIEELLKNSNDTELSKFSNAYKNYFDHFKNERTFEAFKKKIVKYIRLKII